MTLTYIIDTAIYTLIIAAVIVGVLIIIFRSKTNWYDDVHTMD
jgi:hypothetical protein